MAANNAQQDHLDLLQQIGRLNADNQAQLQAAADALQLQAAAVAAVAAAAAAAPPVNQPPSEGVEFNKSKAKSPLKMIPPSAREPHTKMIESKRFHWCIHHMAWTVHHPDHCRLICPGASKAVPPPSTASLATATTTSTEAILGCIETTLSRIETTLFCIESAGETLSSF